MSQKHKYDKTGYDEFVLNTDKPWCWYCGRGYTDIPDWWHAPWVIERAHIVNKPRAEDRRAAILLCSLATSSLMASDFLSTSFHG